MKIRVFPASRSWPRCYTAWRSPRPARFLLQLQQRQRRRADPLRRARPVRQWLDVHLPGARAGQRRLPPDLGPLGRPGSLGLPRVGAYVANQTFTDFRESVDIVSWNQSLAAGPRPFRPTEQRRPRDLERVLSSLQYRSDGSAGRAPHRSDRRGVARSRGLVRAAESPRPGRRLPPGVRGGRGDAHRPVGLGGRATRWPR